MVSKAVLVISTQTCFTGKEIWATEGCGMLVVCEHVNQVVC